uniref:C2H2-type domain-containing protein n=1 Tax=Oryza punctata TaxID=4537 RepID=A0A0E0L6N8_ORYPU
MEFWGLEVKPGQTVKCEPEDERFLHLSQAALGESKKGSDNAVMYVKTDDQKLVIGTLSADKFPQIQFDLVFDKEFELSHTSKTANEEEEEKIIPAPKANGKVEGKENERKKQGKTDSSASKSKAAVNDEDDDDSDEDDSEDEDLSPEDDDDDDSSEDDSSEDDEDESDEEETPKKPETGKRKAAEIVLKTPSSDKKAKIATPSGDKKGVHVATPHPAKQASKTPVNDKAKEKSPKSGGGSISCKSCSKTFNSEMALQSHSKAKHPAK